MHVELQEAWLGFDQAAPLYQKTGDAYFDDNVLEMKSQEPLADFLFLCRSAFLKNAINIHQRLEMKSKI